MDLPDIITSYKSYLEKNHSRITVKNYISDIKHFTEWFAKTQNTSFRPDLLGKKIIQAYQRFLEDDSTPDAHTYSYKSSKRHLSSLRSFTAYLKTETIISENPFELSRKPVEEDLWKLKGFKNFLYENSSSDLTVKYYINDIQSFSKWYEESVQDVNSGAHITLTSEILTEYSRRLEESLLLSPKTINRKLSSLRRYLQYLATQERLTLVPEITNVQPKSSETVSFSELTLIKEEKATSKIPPVRFFQKLTKPYTTAEDRVAGFVSDKIVRKIGRAHV